MTRKHHPAKSQVSQVVWMRPTVENYGISICGSTRGPRPLPAKTELHGRYEFIMDSWTVSYSSRTKHVRKQSIYYVNVMWIIIASAKVMHCLKSAHKSKLEGSPKHTILCHTAAFEAYHPGWSGYTIAMLSACLLPYSQIPVFIVQKIAIAFLFA